MGSSENLPIQKIINCLDPLPVGSSAAEVSSEGPGVADSQTHGHPDTGVGCGYLEFEIKGKEECDKLTLFTSAEAAPRGTVQWIEIYRPTKAIHQYLSKQLAQQCYTDLLCQHCKIGKLPDYTQNLLACPSP